MSLRVEVEFHPGPFSQSSMKERMILVIEEWIDMNSSNIVQNIHSAYARRRSHILMLPANVFVTVETK